MPESYPGWTLAGSQTFVKPSYSHADATIVAGRATDVSGETRRARARSGAARGNTNANRRNGGGSCYYRPRAEDYAGSLPATRTTVKTRDERGLSLRMQRMTDTRKEHPTREIAKAASEDQRLREIERRRIETIELRDYK